MNMHDMTEIAYRNGYEKGVKDFAKRLNEHLCNYDLDNYHSFKAVEEDVIADVLKEMVGG